MASLNEELEALPVTGVRSSEAMGKLLLFPRTGIVGVPFEHVPEGWNVVVVAGDAAGVYPPGGWHIFVGRREIERSVEVPLTDLPLLRAQHPPVRNP